jgi:branched-chain amino acid transport system substrate-binding protein
MPCKVKRRLLLALYTLAPARACPRARGVADSAPYPIDVILPLTGPGAFLGQSQQKTLKVLEEVVNKDGGIRGRPVQFTFYDDQTSPPVALQLTNQILTKKPAVVMGSAISAMCNAQIPAMAAAKTLQWCFSPTFYPPQGGYTYASSVASGNLILGMVRYMHGRGMRKIALLSTTDASGHVGETDMLDVLKRPEFADMTLVANEHYGQTDIGVGAQLTKIKAAAPDAIMVWTAGTPLGTALHGIQDAGMDGIPIFTSSANMIYSQIKSYASIMPKALYFQGYAYTSNEARTAIALKKVRAFQDAAKANGIYPDAIAGFPWDPAMTVIDALRSVGPDATGEQLRAWVAKQNAYPGIAGIYNFTNDMHGLSVDDMLVMRWNPAESRWVTVSNFGGTPLARSPM